MKALIMTLALLVSLITPTYGAPKATNSAKTSAANFKADMLSAKTVLEEMLVKRYSQDLSTIINQNSFVLGAQIELRENLEKKSEKPKLEEQIKQEPFNDLMLGALEPEQIMKTVSNSSLSTENSTLTFQSILAKYRIVSVMMSVGLSPDLPDTIKPDVEKWLSSRLSSEFGNAAKSSVSFIKKPTDILNFKEPEGNLSNKILFFLDKFQSLASQIILVLGLLFGVILWFLFGKPSNKSNESEAKNSTSVTVNGATGTQPQNNPLTPIKNKDSVEEEFSKDIYQTTQQLLELLPRVTNDIEKIIISWCQMGEEGLLRLTCFAEAVGKDIGKLPIPIDTLPEVSKAFSKMPTLKLSDKKDSLQKAYWDILKTINLGTDSLRQPFDYVGGIHVDRISSALIDENPRMKTLVSLYMPQELRASYLRNLSYETKQEIIRNAIQLNQMSSRELNSMDVNFKDKFRSSTSEDIITFDMTLNKIVTSLSPIDEIHLLTEISNENISEFKRQTASLAFITEWPDDALTMLLTKITNEELIAYLRIQPQAKDRLLSLCPNMTSTIVSDELDQQDKTNDKEKNRLLTEMHKKLNELVKNQQVQLDEIFPTSNETNENNKIRHAS